MRKKVSFVKAIIIVVVVILTSAIFQSVIYRYIIYGPLSIYGEIEKDNIEVVSQKLSGKPNLVNKKSYFLRETLLHRAASDGSIKMVKFLIEKGANVMALDFNGRTPLYYAITEIPNKRISNNKYINTQIEKMKILINNGSNINHIDKLSKSVFHCAAMLGSQEILIELIDLGANPYKKDTFGKTPIEYIKNEKIKAKITEVVKSL